MSAERQALRDGARCGRDGGSFALNPHDQSGVKLGNPDRRTSRLASAWSRGYWWARRRAAADAPQLEGAEMSTETKQVGFTPGPWEALPNGNAVRSRFVPGDPQQAGELVADLYARGYGVPTAEREANAALIVAAPDLYAALEAGIELVGWWETEDGTMPASAVAWRDKARAALAKARGNLTAP